MDRVPQIAGDSSVQKVRGGSRGAQQGDGEFLPGT